MKKEHIKLWIDDIRTPPEGWTWAKTSVEALEIVKDSGKIVDVVSFDHDLGGDDTTRPVALYMAEFNLFPAVVHVHSANRVGVEWLKSLIDRYGPGVVRQDGTRVR
jgi:hypothetical protein